ncbi:MAG: hypothetical protein KJ069_31995 [Anaerolineae bacterium]|nr:hypothetical protein [Anaerolineae bacterium]
MDKETLQKRYQYLWTGEAFSAILFAAFLLWFAYQEGVWQKWIIRTYSLGIVILILIQGIVWWRWKLRLLRNNQRRMPAHVLNSFLFWRRTNWWLIGGFPLVVVIATQLTAQSVISTDVLFGLLILGGAMLEQINYYYVQLMYDSSYDWTYLRTHHRLRRGTIAKAFDEYTTK